MNTFEIYFHHEVKHESYFKWDFNQYTISDFFQEATGYKSSIYGSAMLVVGLYLSKNVWYSEAKAIKERTDGEESLDEIQNKLKKRISYGAIYDLFEKVNKLQEEN